MYYIFPADLLLASMAAEPFSSTYLLAGRMPFLITGIKPFFSGQEMSPFFFKIISFWKARIGTSDGVLILQM